MRFQTGKDFRNIQKMVVLATSQFIYILYQGSHIICFENPDRTGRNQSIKFKFFFIFCGRQLKKREHRKTCTQKRDRSSNRNFYQSTKLHNIVVLPATDKSNNFHKKTKTSAKLFLIRQMQNAHGEATVFQLRPVIRCDDSYG